MLTAALAMFLSGPFLMLRLSGGTGSFPKPLSAADEQKYVTAFLDGDIAARNMLVEHNLRLVAHIAKKYFTQADEQDDLISIGTIGLIKGVSTYRPDRKVKLATYCSRCIENEILMYFRSQKKSAGDVSLSDSIDTDKDGEHLSLMDILCVEDDMIEALSARETRAQLNKYIAAVLTERESEIIAMRYGLNNTRPKTQREIAAARGISRSYVSRIEKKALEKLRLCFDTGLRC
ncbi:MAG: RNA polymerase sporulation sigma factor SigK [Oscillospiraceae bacterium]|jgi:RNA polymerase sporulation-specific sigma factor|nr:RNA polymerase sporulation sigma factor SigK [Oscillospiraceae bacterium]